MSPKKKRAMEECYKARSVYRPKPVVDTREEATLETIQKEIRILTGAWWMDNGDIKGHLSRRYKNGAKLYDLAMELEKSPLMKALS